MSVAGGNVQEKLEQVRARVQEATQTARSRVEEVRTKVGAGNGLGLGFMDRFTGGVSGQGAIMNRINRIRYNRPVMRQSKTLRRSTTRRSGTRKSLANNPNIADDTYAQNSSKNTKTYSQDLNVEL